MFKRTSWTFNGTRAAFVLLFSTVCFDWTLGTRAAHYSKTVKSISSWGPLDLYRVDNFFVLICFLLSHALARPPLQLLHSLRFIATLTGVQWISKLDCVMSRQLRCSEVNTPKCFLFSPDNKIRRINKVIMFF